MIKLVFVFLLVMSSYFGFSQNAKDDVSVEKSVFGIQIGLLGIWAHNELKLSNQVALRSEIGLGGVNTANIVPILALEPRWYYNLNERADKNKRIDGNSGNYFSLRASYHFRTALEAEDNDVNRMFMAPTWGIRRNLGDHFNYEVGVGGGLGYRREVVFAPYVNLRIGYRF
ncbi:hypothetical protein [Aquimarina sp. AU474]|uniref:hypothetical protein n=1 Tax=Aquimarina sp. AU474 TaxID=2108529 RepID=UPI00135A0507|nr:hypothetical protein [Aquimarina sp. AU474]